ncbi:hypothetical protein BC567DRAFT_237671 [Phyllosticta citribraziliensis]
MPDPLQLSQLTPVCTSAALPTLLLLLAAQPPRTLQTWPFWLLDQWTPPLPPPRKRAAEAWTLCSIFRCLLRTLEVLPA